MIRPRCAVPVIAILLGWGFLCPLWGQGDSYSFYPPLGAAEVQEVQEILASMKSHPRGPYLRLRWFCNDGTIHPPQGTPCRNRGGGHQHAELSREAERLAELGFHVGAILQSMTFEEFADPESDYLFLKEQVIQDYLFQIDHGWVLRRARTYRGARQIEDEERRGALFLEGLFSQADWLRREYLLATQLVQVIPHPTRSGASTSRIRNLATQAADLDARLQDLRIRIHSFPSPADLTSVRRFLAENGWSAEVRRLLEELAGLLESRYQTEVSGQESKQLLDRAARIVEAPELAPLQNRVARLETLAGWERLVALGEVSGLIRETVQGSANGSLNLLLLDLNQVLQEDAFRVAQTLDPEEAPARSERLRRLQSCFRLAYGAGFLSQRELDALLGELEALLSTDRCTLLDYKRSLNYLTRSLDWAEGTVRRMFSPVFQRYRLVEPETAGFYDALIRSSNLFHLAVRLAVLQRDVDGLIRQTSAPESSVSARMRGLNPGIAVGVLEVLEDVPANWQPKLERIYVIPETVAELRPVAGLITLDAGNLLSHVQLLARNLDIPNAAVSSDLLDELRLLEGMEVLYAVSPLGRVLLKKAAEMTATEQRLVEEVTPDDLERVQLDTGQIRLDVYRPVPLEILRAAQSGVLAGPKAANLGELARLFPGRVARGVVLPFGAYRRHVGRSWKDADSTLWDEMQAVFERAEQMRAEGFSQFRIDEFMFPKLAYFREAIEGLPLVEEDRDDLIGALAGTFGEGLDKGVFVRSDTNVEDLPQFSGAGLNLTVANLRSIPAVLQAVKQLWASPFAERAYLWRSRVMDDLGAVYPSVLILESVASEKSGVLITTGLDGGPANGLTVATAEGVGGAVQGEAAEMLLIHPDGSVKLLSQAKAPFRRVLSPEAGGVVYEPASGTDYLLTDSEIRTLRQVAEKVRREMPADNPETVWDLEFGFVDGHLWLFQIRPFVEHRTSRSRELLSSLDQEWRDRMESFVDLR